MLDQLLPRTTKPISIKFIEKRSSWMADALDSAIRLRRPRRHRAIEHRARISQKLGPRPIWPGYAQVKNYPRSVIGERTSNDVRTDADTGAFYAWLARRREPKAIVEFGTAFGISGMYWLDALEETRQGHLFTFEPNSDWAKIAKANLASISDRFTLTVGTFEDFSNQILEENSIDIALIDAIHTREFVSLQYSILKRYLSRSSIVIIDDINFSDDMSDCWREIASDPSIAASAEVGERIGIVELI